MTIDHCTKYPTAHVRYADMQGEWTVDAIDIHNRMLAISCDPLYTDALVADCVLILRRLDQLTAEERAALDAIESREPLINYFGHTDTVAKINYLRSICVDVDGLLDTGDAVCSK